MTTSLCARSSRAWAVALTSCLLAVLLMSTSLVGSRPSRALPVYSRRYAVPCETCHSVPPRLNRFGLAFQANHFNWPGGPPPADHAGLAALPVSGLGTLSRLSPAPDGAAGSDFRTQELFLTGGLRLGGAGRGSAGRGGYFVDYFAATRGAGIHPGDLGDAYAALPIAGRRGQWALTAGQFTPIMYQYDPINSLTATLPSALNLPADDQSLDAPGPGVQLEFFNNRGRSRADGDYLDVGVPFSGLFSLTRDTRLYSAHGLYAHAFRRAGDNSLGVFGYTRAGNYAAGLLGTQKLAERLSLLEIGDFGHDGAGAGRRLSVQADYVLSPYVALTGRWEAMSGGTAYPVAALTFYPFNQHTLRLTGETVQQRENRSSTLYALVQF